jgi:CRISPR-associated protein Cmr1
MQKLTATYRIVTPLFLGGADQKATDIRPPSVKGALRFWWRALNWGRIRSRFNNDAEALRELNQQEADLFGAAAVDKTARGQSKVLIRTVSKISGIRETTWPSNQTPSGYLGLGLFEMNNHHQREAISEGKDFDVELIFSGDTKAEQIEQVRYALIALGLLGGLGSRSRRAFGSIALQKINQESFVMTTQEAYRNEIKKLMDKHDFLSDSPPYTAFSSKTKIALFNQGKDARDTHAKLGAAYKQYRGQPSRLRGRIKAVFGLPLTGVSEQRRASPLLMHIHPVGSSFQAVVTYLPAVFHPQWERVHDYVVEDFLEGKEIIKP